jgi:hypothetical protein
MRSRRLQCAAALALLALIAALTLLFHLRGFRHGGLDFDVLTYRYQLQTFAEGRLANPSMPMPSFFQMWGVVDDGQRAFAKYFPGHALVLLPLYLLTGHSFAALAPLMAMLCALGMAAPCALLGGRRAALWALGLLAASPYFLLMSSNLLSHSSTLLLQASGITAWMLARRSARVRPAALWAAAAGLAFGLAFATRPLTALAVIVPAAAVFAADALRRRPRALLRLAAGAGPLVLAGAASLAYNAWMTGDPLLPPFYVYWPRDRIGFGPLRGMGAGPEAWDGPWVALHTPWQGLADLGTNLVLLDRWIFGIQGSLAAAVLVALAGLRRSGLTAERGVLLAALVLQPLLYTLLWWPGRSPMGPVYYFEMLLPVVVLAASALSGLVRGRLRWLAAALVFLVALEEGWRLRILPTLGRLERLTSLQEQSLQQIARRVEPPALVLVPASHLGKPFGALVNGPDPASQPILYALDRGEHNAELLARFPGRAAWLAVRVAAEPRPWGWRLELVRLAPPDG